MATESIKRLCRKSQDICSGMKKLGKIRYEFGTGIAVGGPYDNFQYGSRIRECRRAREWRRETFVSFGLSMALSGDSPVG